MIGIFDSGFGGLTVFKSFIELMPGYDYVYLGDNARAPYGNKSPDVIYRYAQEAVGFLFGRGCELIIIACNTVSSEALRKIQQEWLVQNYPERRVLGVVIPIAEVAAEKIMAHPSRNRIGIIGTRSTIESGAYTVELKKIFPRVEIHSQPCPLLVPLVEEGWIDRPETSMILKHYLNPLKAKRIDHLILGCTHYPLLLMQIKKIMGNGCRVFDSPSFVAQKLADYLERHPKIENRITKEGKRVFCTTDDVDRFRELGGRFLGKRIDEVEKVVL